jgi:hypothetical protein
MLRFLFIYGFLLLLGIETYSQILNKTIPFNVGTPYLEPDGRDLSLKLSNDTFVTLAKAKGGVMGPSNYVLEKFTKDLKSIFKVSVGAEFEEDFFKMTWHGNVLRLFAVIHDSRALVSKCKIYDFNVSDGKLLDSKIIAEKSVGAWTTAMGKAVVEEDFITAVASAQPRNFVTPLEYIYQIRYSPDQTKFVLYIFDYSQKYLIAQATVFDENLNVLSKGLVPIDNNFINYGIHLNNKGELFILNVDRGGRIALIKYNMETKDNVFLDISSSSAKRYGFKVRFLNDDEVYVFNLASRSDAFAGVMYSKFNFKNKLVDKLNYHDLSEGMVQTSTALRQNNSDFQAKDDWLNYVISDVYLNAYEKIIVVLEKQYIESAAFNYQASTVSNADNWYEKSGRVIAGPLMLFSFNADDVLLWETYSLKEQSNDISAGLLSASYAMNITDAGKIQMVFASGGKANGVYNEVNYMEFEEASGSRIKNVKLDNPDGLGVLKDYTVWFDDAFIVGARKGLFGNKSFLVRYNAE